MVANKVGGSYCTKEKSTIFATNKREIHAVITKVLSLAALHRLHGQSRLHTGGRRNIATISPNRVNRAHWPTKENKQNFNIFSIFPAHAKNGQGWPQMGPGAVFSC